MDLAALHATLVSEIETARLADVAVDDVSGISAEAVVRPIYAPAEGQPPVTGAISAASSDTTSRVGGDAVAPAMARAMALQLDMSAKFLEIVDQADGPKADVAQRTFEYFC